MAAHVRTPEEPDFWIEVRSDRQVLDLDPVTVSAVIEPRPIAGVVTRASGRIGLRPIRVEGEIVEETERRVESIGLVSADATLTDRSSRVDESYAALTQHVALDTQSREIRRSHARVPEIVRLNVQQPEGELPDSPGQPPTSHDRYFVSVAIEPDTTTVEQRRCVVRGGHACDSTGTSAGARAAKVERALILEEELAFLGKEQAESGEIDLLL